MHGRLKLKTTAEQEAEKQKERQKKLTLYTAACQKAAEKRNLKEYDTEALTITSQMLQSCPDHYTIWNFRKEIINHITSEKSEDKEEVQRVLEKELLLTEASLRKNPKSYGAWHHRKWALLAMPNPNWKKELHMCGKYLQLDERNFNGWGHRRFVYKQANVSPEEELSFTSKKIEENFSNYSAWHYRSSLLPLVHPGKNNVGPRIDQETLLKEYELVQNAAFTDPNDQSAWFYHRWLLGRDEFDLCLLYCHLERTHNKVTAVFTKPIKKNMADKVYVLINGHIQNCQWNTPDDEIYASTVWCTDLQTALHEDADVEIIFDHKLEKDQLKCTPSQSTVWKENYKDSLYSLELSAATSEVLQQELESCQQLLDMEPDNKWTLLTCVLLLRALNSLKHEETVLTYLDQLVSVDPTRRNYYLDMRSKCIIENSLSTFLRSSSKSLDLSRKSLTLFCHADHLVFLQTLNLSNNKLTSLRSLRNLVSLQEMILDSNEVEDCSGLETMTFLQTLSLNNNSIKTFDKLNALTFCENLRSLQMKDNPISTSNDFAEKVKLLFPFIQNVN